MSASLTEPDSERLRAAVSTVARGVLLDRGPQVATVVVRPQRVLEHQFGVRRLPQQEVRDALLAAGANEEIDVRHLRLVEVAREHLVADLRRVEAAGRDVARERSRGVSDLGPA